MTDTMVATRELGWMKLGKLHDGVMTSQEALTLSGLDFTVSKREIQSRKLDGTWETSTDRMYVSRDTDDKQFDVVSKDYSLLQYGEAFEILDGIHPEFVAAASLKGGKQGFMATKLPEHFNMNLLNGEDPHELFIIMRTSHDRSRGIEIALVPIRNKCTNQLTLASLTQGAPQRWSIKHVGDVKQKAQAAAQILKNVPAYATAFTDLADRLAAVKLTTDTGEKILRHIIRKSPQQDELIQSVLATWQTDPTVGYTDNGWGFVNAVSTHMDWKRSHGNPESRFLGAIAGQTYNAINKSVVHVLRHA